MCSTLLVSPDVIVRSMHGMKPGRLSVRTRAQPGEGASLVV